MDTMPNATELVDIVFDGPPGPVSGRFIEVEDQQRRGVGTGEWIKRDDGYWVLRVRMLADDLRRLADALGRRDPDVRTVCAYECGIEDGERESEQLLQAAVEVLEDFAIANGQLKYLHWWEHGAKPLLDKLKAHTEKGEKE